MRLASFNVENMFERAAAMNLDTWAEGKIVLQDFARLNELVQEASYTDAIKAEIAEILARHRGLATQGESKYIVLRDIRGKFLYKPQTGPVQVIPEGRADWIGWFELKTEPVKETATENTARVIGLLDADVLCVVEAEDRTALRRFNSDVLPKVDVTPYKHIMVVDGNDDRRMDVGIMTRAGFDIDSMCSHVEDTDAAGAIFSRDCAEYEVRTPQGNALLVLINHFKSKGYGAPTASAAKRLRQATRVREIYEERLSVGYEYIAIVGDLNEAPGEPPMDPLIRNQSTLVDIMEHPSFAADGRPGTYGNGTASLKLDYILMSPALAQKVVRAGIERQGVWGGAKGTLFPHLPTIKGTKDAASDHAALWVEFDL